METSFDVFAEFATDEKKENDGVWVDIGKGARLLVARAGNRKYSRLLTAAIEKHQRALDLKDEAADKLSDQITIDVAAEAILLGWEKLSFKGQDMGAYSVTAAKQLLAVKDFRHYVSRLSNDFDRFRVAQEAALGKN
jgi:hypothetical protein